MKIITPFPIALRSVVIPIGSPAVPIAKTILNINYINGRFSVMFKVNCAINIHIKLIIVTANALYIWAWLIVLLK